MEPPAEQQAGRTKAFERHTTTDADVQQYATSSGEIEAVKLNQCWKVTTTGFVSLVQACPGIRQLWATGCEKIGAGAFVEACRSLALLTQLDVSGCELHPSGAKALAAAIM